MRESYKGLMMKPNEIDSAGNWVFEGKMIPLLGSTLPVPESARLRGEDEEQEVLMVTTAVLFGDCPYCGEAFTEETPMLVTVDGAKMIPARCCDTFIWMTDKLGEEYDGRNDA